MMGWMIGPCFWDETHLPYHNRYACNICYSFLLLFLHLTIFILLYSCGKTTNQITEPMSKLFQGKNLAFVSTLMKDGSPQVTPTWVDIEDGNIIVNTAEGRLKHKNISRDPRIAVCVVDQNNPYHMVTVRG